MNEIETWKLGEMGHELTLKSGNLHKDECARGKLYKKVVYTHAEDVATKPDPECLGCKAEDVGYELMRLLGPKGFYQVQGVDDDAGEE